jgi:puromycin-sensitive aminopeptidase
MASSFRLAPHVRPRRYQLELELDPAQSLQYRGRVRIWLELQRSVRSIVLHAADLRLSKARVGSEGHEQAAAIELLPQHEAARIVLPSALRRGEAVLELHFSGKLRSDLRGLYFARSGKQRYAFTQLEPADARRFFPCFDEPAFKARLALEVVTDARHTVLANAPPVRTQRLAGGKKRVRFAETPLLSSYLFALAVGELHASRMVRAGKTPIRVWHVPGQERLTEFALRAARECLLRLTRYFGVPYAYQKLDLVAVPDFDMGAMENAGAVFFRETLLLIDEQRATLTEKKRAAEVICHELAHMWYGNLVTMAWWDDLWLNEAFATWMAFDIVDEWQPELHMWHDFGHSRSSALALDALRNTHPIYTRVRTPADATQSFDLITYEKGASVVRMLERYLGPARFRRGVRDYIRKHREGNATASDLWHALERHAQQPVESLIRPWIERPGFPLLRVRAGAASARGELRLTQERYSARGPQHAPNAAPWPVPVVLKFGGTGRERSVRLLLAGRQQRLQLPRTTQFVYANADESGFYRPLHDAASLRALAANSSKLSAAERLGLVSHTWAHVHAGYADVSSLLELCTAFADEPDPDVLAAWYEPLSHVVTHLAETRAQRTALRSFVAELFGPALRAAGIKPRKSDSEQDRRRRGELLSLIAVLAEDRDAVEDAQRLLARYLRAPASVDANLAGAAVVVAARSGDRALHARYLERSKHAKTPQERRRFRLGLAEWREPAGVARTLALCTNGQIPTQDVALVLVRLLHNPSAREATWRFMRRHWRKLEARLPGTLVGRVIEATPELQSEAHRRQLLAFFARHPVPMAERAIKQAGERFRLDAALRKRAAPALGAWLSARHV